jgi:hypothetical protein
MGRSGLGEGFLMKTLAPVLVLLAAGCNPPSPDLTPLTKELATLRQGLDELRKLEQPKFDHEQAMEDLAKEIRRLHDRLAVPPPAAPGAPAPAILPLAAPQNGNLAGGIGGTQPGVNDHYWVLSKLPVENEERVVLALYQALSNGRGIKLISVRMLNADLQLVEYEGEKPHVKEVLDALKKRK